MDVMESGKPPLKDRGNMVTSVVSPRMSEGTNNSDSCSEELAGKAAELHNGGTQLATTTENVVSSKSRKDTNDNARKSQSTEHTAGTGEKWKLHLDLSDSASTSDNDGSEVEATDKSGEQHKEGTNSISQDDETEDFLGFEIFDSETPAQNCGSILTKLIGLTQASLGDVKGVASGASTSHDHEEMNTSMKGGEYYHSFIPSLNEDGMEVDGEENVKFSLKVVSESELTVKEEAMDDSDADSEAKTGVELNKSELHLGESEVSKSDYEDAKSSELRKNKKKKVKEKEVDDVLQETVPSANIDDDDDVDDHDDDDSTKQPAEIPMDTSSLDATTPTKGDIGLGNVSEEISSEMTSSAASSPSVSSRGSFKISASGGSSAGRFSRGDSPALSSSGRTKKSFVDLSNPAFLKPFEFGWKRELVYRNTCESSFKKMADIYYYTPLGKKVRSNREVLEHLDGVDLTTENFTFFKEALGLNDPTKEIIRDAKKIVAKDPNATPVKKVAKPKTITPKPSPASDGNSSIVPQGAKGPQLGRTVPPKTFPKIKVSSVKLQRLSAGSKASASKQKKTDSLEDDDMEIGMLPPMWSPGDSTFLKKTTGNSQCVTPVSWAAKSGSIKKTSNEPCSIRCVGVMGLIPSLQCRLCLCLYHPECVGLGTITETIHSYVCKNCQQEGKPCLGVSASKLISGSNSKITSSTTTTPPPPLTPISALGAGSKSSPTDNTTGQSGATPSSPPKLQRLPRLGESGKLITVPRFVKVPRSRESLLSSQQALKGTTNKGTIVGSVTTWLPPSSTIQLSPSGGSKTSSPVTTSYSNSGSSTATVSDSSSTTPPSTTNVQAIARMGGKKYIVVPKHNVLSVSPAMAATATTPTSKSSMQVGDSSPLGDKAPVTLSTSLVLTNTTGRTSTVLGGTQALIGQPQVLMASPATGNGDQTISLVQNTTPLTNFVGPGGPILPAPSAYLVSSGVSGGLQNPPGVFLVPFMGTGSTFMPPSIGQDPSTNKTTQPQQPQYLIVNGPPGSFQSGNFIIGNLPQAVKPTDSSARVGESGAEPADGVARDGEETANKSKRKLPTREYEGPATKRLKESGSTRQETNTDTESQRRFMQYFMMNVCTGYSSLLHVFQYLKVQELLRAARVCRMWRDIASHPSLWRTVRMKNSQVGDWEGLVKSLRRHETQHLDLRKMLVPSEDTHAMWDEFCQHIGEATSLNRLDLCRCPAQVVEKVVESCPQLKIINALAIKCSTINLQHVATHKNLQELRLKSLSGIQLKDTLSPLKQLSSLKHLSLTTFKELGKKDPNVLGSLKNLESLELGDCCDFPEEFGPETLSKLKKLERLRLEKGQGKDCPTFSILGGIATLPKLTHLELVNFDVKPGFDKALAQCTNIHRLLIIPTYVTQSATTNHMVLNGVNQLSNSLTHFVWGVTHELLRVTELFVDQCEGQKDKKTPTGKSGKKSWGSDSIPILKPIQQPSQVTNNKEKEKQNDQEVNKSNEKVSDESEEKDADKDESDDAKASAAAPQVEILPLPKLQKLLTSSLPNTKVKILKIPFHATWRQTISEPAL